MLIYKIIVLALSLGSAIGMLILRGAFSILPEFPYLPFH